MKSPRFLPLLGLLAGLAIAGTQYFIWLYAPVEQTLGLVQKVFYFHLPLAWWSMISFFAVFVCGIMYLLKKDLFWDHAAGAAAEIGVLLSGLALITGSIWARKSWNVWWTWDPRLSTTLVMWFVYAAYLIARSMDMNARKRATLCAALGIIAFLDVPLVFYSARLWRSIHPAVFQAKGGGLEPEMKVTVVVCVAAWALIWAWMYLTRLGQLRLAAAVDAAARDEAHKDDAHENDAAPA